MTTPTWVRTALLSLLAVSAEAQLNPEVVVDVQAVGQSYTIGDEQSLSEIAVPIGVGVSLGNGVGFSLRTAYATVTGDRLADLGGLADTQLGVSYRRALGAALVDLSLTSSLPTGQTGLSPDEFATSNALAFDDYAFVLPSLGQGAVISPGITIALPTGDGLAFGVGAAYSARSSYTLFANDTTAYLPGNETILTAGVDSRIGRASSFTLEGSYVLYGDDEYGTDTFSPGDKIAGTMRLALGGGTVRGSFLARYRHVFDGAVGTPARIVGYLRPSQAQVALGLSAGSASTRVGLTAGARYYGTIEGDTGSTLELVSFLADQQVLLDLGVAPTIGLGPNAEFRGSFVYTLGLAEAIGGATLTGYRVGGGVRVGF